MHQHRNANRGLTIYQNFIFRPKYYKTFALGLFAFLCAYVAASTFTPVQTSDASTVTITNNTSDYYITITSADSLPLAVTSKPTGQLAYAVDTINITTNSDNGYKLYVSTSSNDNNIYQNGSSSTASSGYFQPTTGTVAAPAALAQNTWGFALSKVTDTTAAKYNPLASSFANISEYVNNTGAPTTDSTWAGVPTLANSEQAKISEASAANAPNGNDFDIYYGVDASTTLPTGNYSTEITYTAISEGVNQFPTMQDFTAEQCYNMATNTSINLSDSRDDKYYRVTKMADGHCWMTDNLALDGTDAAGNVRVLTPSDSNVTTNRPLAENITNGTTSEYNVVQIYSGVANDVTSSCDLTTAPYCIVNASTKYGNLYNWNAATAGVGLRATTGTVTESICPKGWQLPDNDGVYSFQNLMLHYGLPTTNTTDGSAVQTIQRTPLNFSLVGYYDNSSVDQSLRAFYWSRTVYTANADQANSLHFGTKDGSFYPQGFPGKSYGFSIRCVFSGQPTDPTMQDFTTTQCNNLANHASQVLVDKRNNQFYRIVKAIGNTGDNNSECWMADNLSIYGQDISATDSDFTSPSTYTIPAPITATDQWNTNVYSPATDTSSANPKTGKKVEVSHGLGDYADKTNQYGTWGEPYYNWTVTVAKEDTTSYNSPSNVPDTSICPKGWTLPVNGGDNDTTPKSWRHLLAKTIPNAPITTGPQLISNSILGFTKYYGQWGYWRASEDSQGSYGLFWSGTPSTEYQAYRIVYSSLDIYQYYINPQNSYEKGHGASIRCVLR